MTQEVPPIDLHAPVARFSDAVEHIRALEIGIEAVEGTENTWLFDLKTQRPENERKYHIAQPLGGTVIDVVQGEKFDMLSRVRRPVSSSRLQAQPEEFMRMFAKLEALEGMSLEMREGSKYIYARQTVIYTGFSSLGIVWELLRFGERIANPDHGVRISIDKSIARRARELYRARRGENI